MIKWDFISEEEFMKKVNTNIFIHDTKQEAYKITAEELKEEYKIPIKTQQVQSRYEYIRSKWQKQQKQHSKETIDKEKTYYTTIESRLLVDKYNNNLNLNTFAHSLIDNDKLVKEIDRLYSIQKRRGLEISKSALINDIANFFNITGQALNNRYRWHKQNPRTDKIKEANNKIMELQLSNWALRDKINDQQEKIKELENKNKKSKNKLINTLISLNPFKHKKK